MLGNSNQFTTLVFAFYLGNRTAALWIDFNNFIGEMDRIAKGHTGQKPHFVIAC